MADQLRRQVRAQGRDLRPVRGRAAPARVQHRPQRLGIGLPASDSALRVLFHSKSGNNDEGYNNPEYDKLIDQAGALPIEEALPIYAQAQELLVEDSPAVFTRWRVSNYEIRPWVTGLLPTAQDSENYGDLFFEEVKLLEH